MRTLQRVFSLSLSKTLTVLGQKVHPNKRKGVRNCIHFSIGVSESLVIKSYSISGSPARTLPWLPANLQIKPMLRVGLITHKDKQCHRILNVSCKAM